MTVKPWPQGNTSLDQNLYLCLDELKTWSFFIYRHINKHKSDRQIFRDTLASISRYTGKPVPTNECGSKVGFRTNWVTLSLISKRNWGGSKVSRHAYASRDYLLHILYWIKSWTLAYHCFRNVRCNFVLRHNLSWMHKTMHWRFFEYTKGLGKFRVISESYRMTHTHNEHHNLLHLIIY